MSQHLDFGQLSTDPTFLHDCYMSNVLIILDFFLSLKEVCFWGFPHNLRKSFKMFGPRKCYPRCVNSLLVPNLLNPRNNHILNVLCCTSLERTQNLNASGPAASFFDRGKILCETLIPRCDLYISLMALINQSATLGLSAKTLVEFLHSKKWLRLHPRAWMAHCWDCSCLAPFRSTKRRVSAPQWNKRLSQDDPSNKSAEFLQDLFHH